MQQSAAIICLCFTAVLASPYAYVEDGEGRHYYAVGSIRQRRETSWDLDSKGGVQVQHSDNILSNGGHSVDGTITGNQNLRNPHQSPTVDVKVDYNHDSGSALSLGANSSPGGTDVTARGRINLYHNGPVSVDLSGGYDRHFKGPQDTQDPQFSGMIGVDVDMMCMISRAYCDGDRGAGPLN